MPEEVKKKVVYEDKPVDAQAISVDAPITEAPQEPVEPLQPSAPAEEPSKGMSPLTRSMLVGATPLLFGILSGNTVEGAQVAGENLINEDKIARDAATKKYKGTLEQQLAQLRIQRELAKTATERERQRTKTAGGLEDKQVVEVEGPDGKPIVMTNDEAVKQGVPVWKKSGEQDNFHLEDKMKLESHKASLKKDEAKLDPYKQAKSENELLRLYQKDSGTTAKMADAYSRFQGTMSMPESGPNHIATIFNFMKVLDPGSTVREGEQATAANAGSIPESIRLQYNRILLGKDQKLPPGLRTKMFNEATAMYQSQLAGQKKIDDFYHGISQRRGMESKNIIRSFPKAAPFEAIKSYVNKEGKTIQIDTSKLTPRMKKDLEKDGFTPKGK